MEKLIQITINSTLFTIEESAYQKLSDYLAEIKSAFGNDENGAEIIKDIEARIAEHLKAGGGEFVTIALVDAIVQKMGLASDLCEKTTQEEKVGTKKEDKKDADKRRLYRDEENAILGGVCSGIAAYVDVDPTWVRISFIVLAFFGFGIIIPIYLILWLIIPPAKTLNEKLNMHGVTANLNSIVREVKTRIDDLRNNHKCCDKSKDGKISEKEGCTEICKKNSNELKHRLTKIIEKLFKLFVIILRLFVGAIITLCGLAIIFSFVAGLSVLISTSIPYGIDAFIVNNGLEMFVIALIVSSITAFLIPAILIFFGGVKILSGKTEKRKTHGLLTLGIWMLAIATVLFSLIHIGIKIVTYSKDNRQPTVKQIIISDNYHIGKEEAIEIGNKIKEEIIN